MRVFIVDTYPVFCEGLKRIMEGHELTVVGEAAAYRELLDSLTATYQSLTENIKHAEVLVVDGEIDCFDFLDSLDKVRRRGNPPYVVVVTKETAEPHAA